MLLSIHHFRFSFFVLDIVKFEWQCSQYLELNPTCAHALYCACSVSRVRVVPCM